MKDKKIAIKKVNKYSKNNLRLRMEDVKNSNQENSLYFKHLRDRLNSLGG